jgi:ferric-dicitrate binding protein FerR (iron transport regulator)
VRSGPFLAVWLSLLMVASVAPAGVSRGLGEVVTRDAVAVNGILVPDSTTVFPGDRISTAENKTGEVALSGGTNLLLAATTTAALRSDGKRLTVNLEQGGIAVLRKTDAPIVIEADGASIRPATNSPTLFEVAVNGNSLKVVSWRGDAMVETANRTVEVKAGKELDATMNPRPEQAYAGGGSFLTWVLVAGAAAGATGLVLGVEAIKRPNPKDCTVSPETTIIVCP